METEAQRRFTVSEPGLYQAPSSRTWLLPPVLSVRASAGAIPAPGTVWCKVGARKCGASLKMMGFLRALLGRQVLGTCVRL